ncbi:peptidylprolyl isomerase [Polaribacter porphyrae]|uniref:Uncharacterized protein n=1 Tax=Polaribacter porphyrae TaxID=1137780 RepID=A0A2S7WKM0_9FLAO|nr:peptidylprolyl isomerase [Polaribacter porphyrae]PQJ78150.1 hypothetical protein BTO18_02620 [Polaribacter porphyrae]
MNKIKYIFSVLAVVVIIYACGDDNFISNPFADVNYEELAVSDNDSLVKFLKSHYYDSTLDTIKSIVNGETAMFDETNNLDIINLEENDINYKLYVYKKEQGNPIVDKSFPTVVDSLFINYKLMLLPRADSLGAAIETNTNIWFSSDQNIRGWAHGFTKFLGGNNVTNNGPITFADTGKGYLFIPGGLGYPSINFQIGQDPNARPYDRVLIFEIELLDFVKDTDHDNDGKPSILEDANGDGDPRNDFSDPNNPTLADYLNPNIK